LHVVQAPAPFLLSILFTLGVVVETIPAENAKEAKDKLVQEIAPDAADKELY